ncbi:MAG: radical SAM protein [Bacteroidia bacterium]|nr:radical SAM protein [Bacteroidia bacterium]
MTKQEKIKLIFPPLWDIDLPYLSLPQLSAYLTQYNIENKSFDLNLFFWKKISQKKNLEGFYHWLKLIITESEFNKDSCIDINNYIKIKSYLSLSLEDFNYKVLNEGLIVNKNIRELILLFWINFNSEIFKTSHNFKKDEIPLYFYHDQYYFNASLSRYALRSDGILSLLEDNFNNPYYKFYKSYFSEIFQDEYKYYGISVTGINQVIPSFTLAKIIKENFKDVKVIIGGAWVTQLSTKIRKNSSLFKYIDYFVVGEGEKTLYNIITKDNSEVNNTLTLTDNKVSGNIKPDYIDLNDLPAPTFVDYDLNSYDVKNTLPYQSSRGCSWGKCTFCSYPILDPKYRIKKKEVIFNDFEKLIDKYNTEYICLVDSELNKERLTSISNIVSNLKKKIFWRGFARFDKNLNFDILLDASMNGCDVLIWGMESGSDKILKKIRKGTTITIMNDVLKDAFAAGIHNRVCVMYEIPEETEEDFHQTINFLERNSKIIGSLAFSQFTLEYNCTMFSSLKIEVENDQELFIGYYLETFSSNHRELLEKIYLKIDHLR